MGGRLSKNGEGSSRNSRQPLQTNTSNPDLISYEAECQLDPNLQSFDSALQDRTNRVITSLASDIEIHSLSLNSLREVTEGLLEMNKQVVQVILECKKDIWKNNHLFDLVQDYFQTSLQTLDFCTSLQNCLKRARDSHLIIQLALQQFHRHNGETKDYSKTRQQLQDFKTAGDPFSEQFFSLFQTVYKQQVTMLEKLQATKRKLDNKLKSVKSWRRVTNIIFAATFTAVLICSVVAAAVTAPPVVTALAAAAAVPLGSMGKWINSLWKKYENELKGQREIIDSMRVGTFVVIKDLDSIRLLVTKLEIDMEGLLQNAEFALTQDDAVAVAMDEINKKLNGFMQTIEDLGTHADNCSRHITRARTVILQRIIKHPES